MALCKPLQPLVTSPTMSLRRIALRDFVIVQSLDLDLSSGFSVLTGETGAGKSILIDALQLALGSRADAGVVREGAQRCEVAAEFDSPAALVPWLEEQGFTADEALLLRRTVDTEGRSRAWINGSAATATQLRAVADHLVDIHGQHAWQSLTRADAVRELLDAYAGTDLAPVRHAWQAWRQHRKALDTAREQQASLQQNAERLQWQIAELDKLSPGPDEWTDLNTQHGRLAKPVTQVTGCLRCGDNNRQGKGELMREKLIIGEPRAGGCCGREIGRAFRLMRLLQRRTQIVGGPLPAPDQRQAPHHRADLMVEEAACRGLDDDLLAVAADG